MMKLLSSAVACALLAVTVEARVSREVKWSDVPSLPTSLSDMSATTIGGKIYIIGGCNADQVRAPWDNNMFYCATISDSCVVFDPSEEEYTACAPAPRQRYRHAAVAINGLVWVVGGRDDQDAIVTHIDVYDPATNSWSSPVQWPAATSDLGAFTDGTSLFVAGGYDTSYTNAHTNLWKFDPTALAQGQLTVESMAAMGQGRGDLSAVTLDGFAYVTGGWHHGDWCDPLESVERYDIAQDKWTTIASLGVGRADKAVVVLRGNVFAIGGEHNDNCAGVSGGSVPVDDVEVLDVESGVWTVETNIPDNRFRFVAAADEDLDSIYLFGGQRHYNATCDCFGISDDVMRFSDPIVFGSDRKSAASTLTGALLALGLAVAAAL